MADNTVNNAEDAGDLIDNVQQEIQNVKDAIEQGDFTEAAAKLQSITEDLGVVQEWVEKQ